MNVGHGGRNEPPGLAPAPALGDRDGADLPRPRVDVLEQVADRLQVGEVEIARRDRLKKALGDKLGWSVLSCEYERVTLRGLLPFLVAVTGRGYVQQ